MKDIITRFLCSNESSCKTMRIALAGILSIVISFIPQFLTNFSINPELQTFIAAIIMAAIKPIKDFYVNSIEKDENGGTDGGTAPDTSNDTEGRG